VDPPGEARDDLWIVCQVAKRLGLGFDYKSAIQVFEEIRRTVQLYRGIDPERLGREGAFWPCTGEGRSVAILHTHGFRTPEGRAIITPVQYRPPQEKTSDEQPLILTTGRSAVHYNAGSMSRRSPSLTEISPEPFVEINPSDASKLEICEGDPVVVTSPRGKTQARARLTRRVGRGVVFMPFHFPGTNILTADFMDVDSKMPELKFSSCRIDRRS
jgi:formate dehydrogenase major subunit